MISSLFKFCGLVAIAVSCAIVLFFVVLIVLAGICTVLGAVESATNPNAAQDAAQEYTQLQANISQAQSALSHAVQGVPAGG